MYTVTAWYLTPIALHGIATKTIASLYTLITRPYMLLINYLDNSKSCFLLTIWPVPWNTDAVSFLASEANTISCLSIQVLWYDAHPC